MSCYIFGGLKWTLAPYILLIRRHANQLANWFENDKGLKYTYVSNDT